MSAANKQILTQYSNGEIVIFNCELQKAVKSLNLSMNEFSIGGAVFVGDNEIVCILNNRNKNKHYAGLFNIEGDDINPKELEYISDSPLT